MLSPHNSNLMFEISALLFKSPLSSDNICFKIITDDIIRNTTIQIHIIFFKITRIEVFCNDAGFCFRIIIFKEVKMKYYLIGFISVFGLLMGSDILLEKSKRRKNDDVVFDVAQVGF